MPSIVHVCGQKLHFPREMSGRKGRCPKCGDAVEIPVESGIVAVKDVAAAAGGAGKKMHLDPPPNWEKYQAFLEGKGPNPRPLVVPANLMLKEEADAKWEAAEKKGAPSKYVCPGCKERIEVGALVCMKCGLDFRTGFTLDGKTKVNEAGFEYLKRIVWLQDAPPAEEPKKPLLPRKKRQG